MAQMECKNIAEYFEYSIINITLLSLKQVIVVISSNTYLLSLFFFNKDEAQFALDFLAKVDEDINRCLIKNLKAIVLSRLGIFDAAMEEIEHIMREKMPLLFPLTVYLFISF